MLSQSYVLEYEYLTLAYPFLYSHLVEYKRLAETAPLGVSGGGRQQVQRHHERAARQPRAARVQRAQTEHERRAPHEPGQRRHPRELLEGWPA